MQKVKIITLVIMIVFYFVAGVNHFRNPVSYLRIIPSYIPFPSATNYLSGFLEISLAILLIFPVTRAFGAWGICFLLIAFLPVHISMIGDAPLKLGNFLVTPLIAWIRLVVLQPLLIAWALWYVRPL